MTDEPESGLEPLPGTNRGGNGHEEDLEEILAGYVSRLNAGEKILPEEILVDHPDSGPEIVEQLEAFVGAPGRTGSVLEPQRSATLGDFTLRRQIGRGGMGVVYEAWQRSMDRRVALKVLPAGLLADPKAVARFRREAKVAGRLHHPNVVSVYGVGVEEGSPCFAMEYVEGETLEQVLRRLRPPESDHQKPWGSRVARSIVKVFTARTRTQALPPPGATRLPPELRAPAPPARDLTPYGGVSAREIDLKYCLRMAEAFAGAADGLQVAHAQGIVHRDLKPSNLILDKQGRLRILDFGLARLEGQESLTRSGEFLGTPRYMSPEQARARTVPIDHRTDVYSLGATLYEMLVWRPPFEGRDYQDTIHQIIHDNVPALHRLNPRIPKDLETIVSRCLRKEPNERYRTAEALSQDLRRFVRGDPIEARPQPRWEKIARRAWRYRGQLAAAAVIMALVLTLGWVIADNARQERNRRIADYEPKVLRAVMKMQQGRLSLKPTGEAPGTGSDEDIFGFDFQTLLEDSGPDPVEEAVRELAAAAEILPKRPDAPFHRARGLLVLGRNEEALVDLSRALHADPGFVPARILRAAILERKGDPEGAAAEIRRASKAAAKGWAEVWVSAHLALAERRWKDAAEAYGTLIEKESAGREPYLGSSAETRLGRGVARLELRDFQGAVEDIVAVRTLWPESREPGLLLGKAYLLMGLKEKAEETFQRILERARIHDEVATATAALYSSLQDYEAALVWAEKVRKTSLRERLRCVFLLKLDRVAEAIDAGQKAIEADPNDGPALMALGRAEEKLGGPVKQRERMVQAYRLDPTNTAAGVWLAGNLAGEGKPEEAHQLLQQVGRLEPDSPYVQCAQGKLYEQKGKWVEAFSSYTRAVEVSPDTLGPQAISSAIRLLRRKEKQRFPVSDLVRAIEKALASNPENPAYLLRSLALARVYDPERRGAAKAVQSALSAVEKTGRKDPDMLAGLAEVHFVSGNRVEAVRILEEAVRLPDAESTLLIRLDEYRRALQPRMASYASIEAALSAPEVETLVPEGASWRFFRGKREPSSGLKWTAPEFDDSSWETGPSGFGYGDGDDATVLDDMLGSYTTVYVRKKVSIADPARYRRYRLVLRADDGFVAYLNGVEVGRARARTPGTRLANDATASSTTDNPAISEVWLDSRLFRAGENCLAIQGLNCSLRSSDLTLIPLLEAEISSGVERGRKLLENLRPKSPSDEPDPLLAYLESRLLQMAGQHRQAAAMLEKVTARDPARPEPLLRLAESLAAAGEPAAAEARLREALAGSRLGNSPAEGAREVWDRWLEVCFVDLRWPVADVLAAVPVPAGRPSAGEYGPDVRWLLERLNAGETVRIRCGGGEYRGRDGAIWAKDRFFCGGHVHDENSKNRESLPQNIKDTSDDALYLNDRYFKPDDVHPPAYRVPLPPGEYRVALHFAETSHRSKGSRRFDVLLEGKRVLEQHDLVQDGGYAIARKHEFCVTVGDGFLDLEFGFLKDNPKISAIAIDPVR